MISPVDKTLKHGEAHRRGPGPFVTRVSAALADGRHLVATSRHHRKGLAPRIVAALEVDRIHPTQASAWRHFWAPQRLAWWVAVLFMVGSACFAVGAWAGTWPAETPAGLRSTSITNWVFFVGSLFFTTAAYLQLLEAANGDVAEALGVRSSAWRWLGWRPHNLGWLASAAQLVGTITFNFNTADAMITGLDWRAQDILVWSPNMVGCVCFLVASTLAWVEFSHGAWSFAPRSVSWWIVWLNILGSAAFQISALYSFVRPGPPNEHELWLAGFYTLIGGLCFFLGSYLLIPELFDGDARETSQATRADSP